MPQFIEEIALLERGTLRPAELGLSLAEAKILLYGMQQTLVAEQVDQYLGQLKTCAHCNAPRAKKGQHTIVYRTLFGKLNLNSPRLYDCPCQKPGRRSTSPLSDLLTSHCAPELTYLQTKFASLMSYGLSVDLLSEVCRWQMKSIPGPCGANCKTLRNASKVSWAKKRRSSSMAVPMIGRSCHRRKRPLRWD